MMSEMRGRRKLTQLTVVAEAAAVLYAPVSPAEEQTEDVARQIGKKAICVKKKKKRKLEGEVEEEILVLVAQALLKGSFRTST